MSDERFDTDVLVIGSGFGGSAAALRFADATGYARPRPPGSRVEAA